MVQKNKKIFIIIGAFFIVIGLVLLFEGQLKISTKSLLEINETIEKSDNIKILNTEQKDNIYVIYCSKNNENEKYIYKVVKNPVTNKFSISDRNIANKELNIFNSVIESSFYAYAYEVDLNTGDISIHEKSISNNLYVSILIIVHGIIIIYFNGRRKKQK